MKQTVYSPQEEQALMAHLWSPFISDDPYNFVMFAYPWGVKGKPLEHFRGPRKWQVKVLKRIAEHVKEGREIDLPKLLRVARASGRGIGKSALVAWLIDWFNSTRIGSTAIISANTETQLRTITWAELGKWTAMSIHSHWWEISGITRNPAKWLKELVETQLKKGTGYWGAIGKLWSEENPDAYAGPHNHDGMMVIFDEASGIPDTIWSVANGYFTEPTANRFWFAFSQGRRNSGYFFEIFNKKRDLWDNDQIDARSVEGTDPALYQEIIDEYGEDSDEARVEVKGLFPSDDDVQFISHALVDEAVKRKSIDDKTAPVVIGVDPSRGGDAFVVVVRQGRTILQIRRHRIADSDIGTMEGVGHVIDAMEEWKAKLGYYPLTVVDETGMGGPVGDRLREQKYKVKGVNFAWKAKKPQRWGNKRAEMWGDMKKWLETAAIPDDKRLVVDLVGPRKKPDGKGVMFLESKKDMKGRGLASPDSADALAVTFAYSVASRPEGGYDKAASTQASRKRDELSGFAGHQAGATSWLGH